MACGDGMGLGNGDEGFVVGFEVADEGGVGLDDDVVGVAVGDYGALLGEGVELFFTPASSAKIAPRAVWV